MSTERTTMRRELAELLALASDTQIANVLRDWAADTGYDSSPRLILADLIGRIRATLQADYADPERAAAAVERINAVLDSLRATTPN